MVVHYLGYPADMDAIMEIAVSTCVYEYDLFLNKSAYIGTDCPFDCRYYGKDIKYYKGMCPVAEEILNTSIRLPVSEFYTGQDLKDVIEGINKVTKYYASKSRGV